MAVGATYRYLLADLRSQQFFAELPMTKVSFSSKLNDIGSFAGSIDLADPEVRQAFPYAATTPGRTAIYVERNGTLIWGGILWTRRYAGGGDHMLQIGGKEMLSYLHRRLITVVKAYANIDQLAIVRDLIAHAQAATGGNIGFTVSNLSSGVFRTQTWQPQDYKPIWEAIRDLSSQDRGFDLSCTVAYTGAQSIAITLNLGYPRLGRVASATGLVWEFPGNIINYTWPEDGTVMATKVTALGAGSGPTMLTASGGSPRLIDAGYPLLESTYQWKDITVQSTLNAHAASDAKAFSQPAILPQLAIRADRDPILGSFVVGDDFRLRITDPWWPAIGTGPGLDTFLRIIERQVLPMDAGTAEQVTIVAGAPPTF